MQQRILAPFHISALIIGMAAFSFAGCDGDTKDPVDTDDTETTVDTDDTETTVDTDVDVTDEYFAGTNSAALGAVGNEASCSTCHSATATSNGDPGDPLADSFYLTDWKGGDAPTLLDASNACITGWMGGSALTTTDASWISLSAYLESISDAAVTTPNATTPEVLAADAAYAVAYDGTGVAADGEAKYNASCARCHGGGLTLGPASSPNLATLAGNTPGYIAQKVRTSGPPPGSMVEAAASTDSTPGPMPFFEVDELSVQDLADIVAYITD
jgi:mono/diheme cytochrome c family protein